jgi:hypothetical protein
MKEVTEYRQKLLHRLSQAAAEFRAACEAVKDPYLAIEEGGWNTHQLAAHTRDVDKHVYGMRARRTVNEDNPEFPSFDADAWMSLNYDRGEPLAGILDEFAASVKELAGFLQGLPPEAWSRESRHETLGGGLSMQTWVERGLVHIEEHLASVKQQMRQINSQ